LCDCKDICNQSDNFDDRLDVRFLLYRLIVPGCHAEAHLFYFVLSVQLDAGVVVKADKNVTPGLEVKIQLVPDVIEIRSHVAKIDGNVTQR
jgi:hypothetical protein